MKQLHWQRLVLTCLAAFLTPLAGALQTGGHIRPALLAGSGMALAAAVGFVQQPNKEQL